MKNKLTLGIMQPYFFPYLGYFDLINQTDNWIVFDVVKYTPKSWMNRNRILHPTDGWQYVTVPVNRHISDGSIRHIQILDANSAHQKILGQIEHYRKGGAPYFHEVSTLIDECFSGLQGNLLRDLNIRSLELVCDYLSIDFKHTNLSDMSLPLPAIEHPGQWALEICSSLGANAYLNPPGGKAIFQSDEWKKRKIKLGFTDLVSFSYPTGRYKFTEHLSIIDVLMWNSPATIKSYLDSKKTN